MAKATGGNINFKVNMSVNKSGLTQITKPLQQIQSQLNSISTGKLDEEFKQAASSAKQLESIINSSWNDKLGQLNLDKFNQSVKSSYGSVTNLKSSLAGAGAAGQSAFNALASEVLNTNLQLKESNKLLDDMATSMANTVKWGITSSIFNSITSSIQQAYYYAKDLDTSLTNIRIVTGDSADQMERFAKTANSAAKDLGRSTLDYTNAALSFYQQGLDDEEVQARTETTLKAQNITGAGTEMVDYLTAVWNGFKVQADETEGVVDKLAKVADSSASDMSELAIAMSKVAATANVMGVDVDQLTAQIATVVATTRQAPESVGTAFKTIYSRLNDIKAGADDAEISLGNYSGKMAELGFNVLDANGRLRDTGQVMEQIGSRWATLTKEQQVYLAQTMGGQRQITQITALFDNWTTYSELLNTSLSAQGTLNEKNNRYLESTAAYMEKLGAETERTYDIIFDQDTVNGFASVFTGALKQFNDYIEGIGGGANVFVNFGAAVANIFNKQIGTAISQQIQNIELLKNNLAQVKAQQQWSKTAMDQTIVAHSQSGDVISQSALQKQAAIIQRTLEIRKALTQEQYNELQELQRQVGVEQTRIDYLEQYNTILNQIGLSENVSTQVIQDNLDAKQQELDLQKLIADYIELSLIPTDRLTQSQRRRIQQAEDILQAEEEEAGILVGISDKQENIITRLQTEVLSNKDLQELLKEQNVLIQKQEQGVNKVRQAAEGRKAAEDGTLEKLKEEESARERIIRKTQDQAAKQISIQQAVRMTTGAVQGLSSLIGGISTALDGTISTAERLNGVWSGGTGALAGVANMLAPGTGFLVQGIAGLIKTGLEATGIWDSWVDHFKTVQERIDELNEKLHNVNSQLSSDSKNISSLKGMQDEWDELSKKAGAYGKNLKSMSTQDQQRYHELVDAFTQYNDAVILGYDAQGEKIIANRGELEQTIKLLEQQKRAQVMENLGDINQVFADANAAASQPYENLENLQEAKEDAEARLEYAQAQSKEWLSQYADNQAAAAELSKEITERSNAILNQFTFYGGFTEEDSQQLGSLAERIQEKLDEKYGNWGDVSDWLTSAQENIDPENIGEYAKKFSQFQEVLFSILKSGEFDTWANEYDLSDSTTFGSTYLIDQVLNGQISSIEDLEQAAQDASGLAEKAQGDLEELTKLNSTLIMTFIQNVTGYTSEWDSLRTNENEGFVRQLILDYLSEFNYDPNADIHGAEARVVKTYEQAVQVARNYAAQLSQVFDTVNTEVEKALKNANFDNFEGTVKERTDKALELVNQVLANLNLKDFNTEESRQALASIIAQSFDLSKVEIDVTNGKLNINTSKVVSAYQDQIVQAQNAVYDTLYKKFGYGGQKGGISRDFLRNLLDKQDLENIDQIINSIDWGSVLRYTTQYGDTAEVAFKKAYQEAKKLQEQLANTVDLDFDTVFDSDGVVQHLSARKKLTDAELTYLSTLENQDATLKEIAEREGRSSDNYIKRLKEQGDLGQKIYKNRINAEKQRVRLQVANNQSILDSANATAQAKDQAQRNIIALKEEQVQLNYDLARAEQAIIDKANEREKAEVDALIAKSKSDDTDKTVSTARSTVSNLKDKKQLSANELSALTFMERSDENLAKIAAENGRYSDEYIKALNEALRVQTEIAETKRQSNLDDLEAMQLRLQQERDELEASIKHPVSEKQYETAKQKLETENLDPREEKILSNIVARYEDQLTVKTAIEQKNNEILQTEQAIADITGQSTSDSLDQIRNEVDSLQELREKFQLGEENGGISYDEFVQLRPEYLEQQLQEINNLNELQDAYTDGKIALQDYEESFDKVLKKELEAANIDLDDFEDYVDTLQDMADGLLDDEEAADMVAEANLKLNDGIESLSKALKNHLDTLSDWDEGSFEFTQALNEVRSSLENVFGFTPSADFVKDHLTEIQELANGNIQVLDDLRVAAAQDYIATLKVQADDAQAAEQLDYLSSLIDSWDFNDIEIGANIDDTDFLNTLNKMLAASQITATDAQNILNSLGYSAKVTYDEVPQTTEIHAGGNFRVGPLPVSYSMDGSQTAIVRVPKIEAANTHFVGNKPAQVNRSNRPASTGKSGGKKGGGGGKGKGSDKTKEADAMDALEDTQDRYHDINLQITKVQKNLEAVQDQEKKLTGKDLIDNLNKQLAILDDQVAAYETKIELARQERDEVKNSLKAQGVLFDKNTGAISNYSTILSTKLADVNKIINHYNSLSADEQKSYKTVVEQAKKDYEDFKKQIENYDKLTSETLPDLQKSIRDARDKQIELQIEKFKMKVELELDISKAERDFNKFKKKVIDQMRDDDVLGNTKALFTDLSSYYKEGGAGVVSALTDQVNDTLAQLKEIDAGGWSSVYGDNRAKALEDLKSYSDELMSQLEDVEDLVDEIKDSIFDAIDATQDAFDEQVDEFEYISDLIDHDTKVIKLLYGDDAYEAMDKYYKMQQDNNNKQIEFMKMQKDLWYSRMMAEQARMNNLDVGTNAYKQAEDRFEEYKRHWMQATKGLNSSVEDSIGNIIDKYANAIDLTFDKLNKKITGGKGLDNISEEWELINKEADMYLDKVNSMYEIDKLENAYRDAIKDNDGNLKAQQSLNDMMNEQLKYLKDKEKLTQYDVDRANALLQIEIKRLALEQASQNKSKLRLRRDSQGNYTYQYTADEDQTNKAQQELADAQNDLYNMTKEAYKNNLDSYYDTTEEWQDKIKDVYKDTTLTAEEQQAKIAMLNEYYGNIINGLTQQNEELKQYMMGDTFDALARMYNTDVNNFKNMSDQEKDILMNDMVPYWKSSIQDMADVFAGEGGFLPTVQDALGELNDNTKDYQDSLDTLSQVAGVDFENINNAIDGTIYQAQDLLDANDDLIDAYKDELLAVQDVIDAVDTLSMKYKMAKDEAVAATKAAYAYQQQQNAKAAAAAAKQAKTGSTSGTPASAGSSGSGGNSNKGGNTNTGTGAKNPAKKNSGSTGPSQKNGNATATQVEGIAAAIWMDGSKSGWGDDPQRRQRFIEKFNTSSADAIQGYINAHYGDIYDRWVGKRNQLPNYYYSRFDTGGYTGQWGKSGKFAMLHEKELVLNASDTSNLLSAVSIVRTMNDLLSNISGNTSLPSVLGSLRGNSNGSTLDQRVSIEAHFPNVTNHSEIEDAFNNLVNRASQYAFNTRK